MGREAAIELLGVGKRYHQLTEHRMLLRSILPFARPERADLWALRDVDLRVEPGETIGILGRNGSGKSTMLRLLAAVTSPTEGEVVIRGRVAPLLSVGVGFHPEMSGRENVLVNGMLLGLTRTEVDERFDDIVAFAELAEFIDTPVKFYSSGMFMRLGFAVAVHTDPQVLLVDEVLAVGDVAFQLKCMDRMRSLQSGGTTVVLVSHSMHAVRLLCPRAAVLRRGKLEFDGSVEEAIGTHHRLLAGRPDERGVRLQDRAADGTVAVQDPGLFDAGGRPTGSADHGDELTMRARLRFDRDVHAPQVLFVVRTADGSLAYQAISTLGSGDWSYRAGEEADVAVGFRAGFGGGGTFTLELCVTDGDGSTVLGRSEPVMAYFTTLLGTFGLGDLGARISLDGRLIDEHVAP